MSVALPDTAERLRVSAKVIQGWLSSCLTAHQSSFCADEFPGRVLRGPKRLIQLDAKNSTFRLIDTPDQGNLPPYVALSYVWGTKGNYVTTKSTLRRLQESPVLLAELPKTIREACEVTRLIGLEYIWVDALCIVQDDEDEKITEIANMAAVYWNAWLQIAAMGSRGADDGLLRPREPGGYTQEQIDDHHLIMKACRSLKQHRWDGQLLEHYPLLTRGWTFQERILARRCVHFTSHELVWECKRERWCECTSVEGSVVGGSSLASMPGSLINNMSGAFLQCINLAHTKPQDAALARTIPMWRECVMSYSKRYLTDMEDRLLAISGIARMIRGEEWSAGYVAGLWKDAMPFDLLWRCDTSSGGRLRDTKERRPSWSWCSVGCGVNWPALAEGGADQTGQKDPLDYVGHGTYFEEGLDGVKVRRVEMNAPTGVFGRVRAGLVELEARTATVRIRTHEKAEEWRALHETEWVIEGTGETSKILPYYPDLKLANTVPLDEEYVFVEVVSHHVGGKRWEAGLVVTRTEEPDTHERIGMAGRTKVDLQSCPEGWFKGAGYGIIKVV